MKRRMMLLQFCLLLCLLPGAQAWGQSYTIRFVKGTNRIDPGLRTANSLSELVCGLTEQKAYAGRATLRVTLTALQSVTERYDSEARALSFSQAQALQDYLTRRCGADANTLFDIRIDAQTDLKNRVIAEISCEAAPPRPTSAAQSAVYGKQATTTAMTGRATTTTGKATTTGRAKPAPVIQQKPASAAPRFLLGDIGIGVKTNVLLFAGLLPDGSMYSPVVNAAAEVYFMKRFSAQLSFAYAMSYNKGEKTDLFSLTGFVVEPRWWLRGDGTYQGLYVGLYGQYGTFDVRIQKEIDDNCTGSFYGGGLSAGWLQPVWRGFFAEAGLQVGYRSDAVDVYSYTPGSPYKRLGSYTLNSFTLQGFNLGVGYRF